MRIKRRTKTEITSGANRLLIVMLLTILAIFAMSSVAFAGEVSYEGQAGGFVFSPGSSKSPTDLFTNFSNVMPGDELTDSVDVKNNSGKTVRLYIKATGVAEGNAAFLSEMNLKVNQNGGGTLFDAPANQTAGLTDWVLLGTMSPGAKATLDLTLGVPITMGNENQDAMAKLGWQFKAEEIDNDEPTETTAPIDPANPDDPDKDGGNSRTKTGDISPIRIIIAIMIAAAAAVIIIFLNRRRK